MLSTVTSKITREMIYLLVFLLFGCLFVLLVLPSTSSSSSPSTCSSASSLTSSSSSISSSSDHSSNLLQEQCVTYKQRFSLCMNIQQQLTTKEQRKFFFSQFLRSDPQMNTPHAKEVALYRIHRIKAGWSSDFWLNVCSWITESTGLPIIPIEEMMAVQNNPTKKILDLFMSEKYSAVNRKVRDTFLYTLGGHEDSVPLEFQDFIKIHLEEELPKIFLTIKERRTIYTGGYSHGGDLAAGMFMKINPHYDWCWIFESDTRFAGSSWHRFLTMSRAAGKEGIDHTPSAPNDGTDGIGKEAHLIWFSPRMLNYGYGVPYEYSGVRNSESPSDVRKVKVTPAYRRLERQYWRDALEQRPVPSNHSSIINTYLWNFRLMFFGDWTTKFENTVFTAVFVPAVGFSRQVAMKLWKFALAGDGHLNQELMLPLTAQLEGLKMTSLVGLKIPDEFMGGNNNNNMKKKRDEEGNKKEKPPPRSSFFPFQFYFGAKARNETSPMYVLWREGSAMTDAATMHNGIHTFQFRGRDCLQDVLIHPVKY